MSAYSHVDYPASLVEFGQPLALPSCGGWLLVREIPGTPHCDAMGPYPLFCCNNWEGLQADMEALRDKLVSAVLVTDPFCDFPLERLRALSDICYAYKEHYTMEFHKDWQSDLSSSLKKKTRQSLKVLNVSVVENPVDSASEWTRLYQSLVERHSLHGMHAFSLDSFRKQLSIPGCVLFKVEYDGRLVGGNIFYITDDHAYGHLSAFTTEGYELRAPYAVKWVAYNYLAERTAEVDIGGVPGKVDDPSAGLGSFKSRWANKKRPVYLWGKILNANIYTDLVAQSGFPHATFFPAYRANATMEGTDDASN